MRHINRKTDLLVLENVSFIKDGNALLKNINLDLSPGRHWILLGKNGSGKTTLVNLIFGISWPSSGKVTVLGNLYGTVMIREIQKKIGILQPDLQEASLQKELTAAEIIATGLAGTIGLYETPAAEAFREVDGMLLRHNLAYLRDRVYSTLSAGEKRKILLLRAVISKPELLILDEPCSSFDISAREDFFNILEELQISCPFQSIMITHRLDEIPAFYKHGILLKKGEVLQTGLLADILNTHTISELYDLPVEVIERNGRYTAIVSFT